jgi:hypothetical protein
MTLIALILGVLAHALKQVVSARRLGAYRGLYAYVVDSWPESLLAAVCSVGLYLGLPELALLFPDLAATVGLPDHPTIIGSFFAGFVGNSLADVLGGRLVRLVQ